jgi:hypothetical protein
MKQKKVSNATYDFFYFFSFKKLGEWVWVIGRRWVYVDEMRQENEEEMKDKRRRYWILCPPWEV